MKGIHVCNETGTLKKVLLHRPGKELLNISPDTMDRLLFDDIPYLKIAQEEHDAFTQVFRDNGVEVVYLEDLMTETLEQNPNLVVPFLYQWLQEGGVYTGLWKEKVTSYLLDHYSGKDLVLKTMEGVNLKEISDIHPRHSLVDLVSDPQELIVPPMPNLYFTRDPFASVGKGACINHMRYPTRNRETLYAQYILHYHDDFKGQVPFYYDRDEFWNIEGGDILNLSPEVLAIGISERTGAEAIEALAKRIFRDESTLIKTILAFRIPAIRAFMHLDTVFTALSRNQYAVHPEILKTLQIYKITKGKEEYPLDVEELDGKLEDVLKEYTKQDHVELIRCGGRDSVAARREQWSDGSNTLALGNGKVIVYQRNDVTNQLLREHGIEIIPIKDSELSRGRGGPRCMSMPLYREEL